MQIYLNGTKIRLLFQFYCIKFPFPSSVTWYLGVVQAGNSDSSVYHCTILPVLILEHFDNWHKPITQTVKEVCSCGPM